MRSRIECGDKISRRQSRADNQHPLVRRDARDDIVYERISDQSWIAVEGAQLRGKGGSGMRGCNRGDVGLKRFAIRCSQAPAVRRLAHRKDRGADVAHSPRGNPRPKRLLNVAAKLAPPRIDLAACLRRIVAGERSRGGKPARKMFAVLGND